MLSLDVSHESRSLFPGVWWHKGGLAVLDKGFSSEIEESPSGGVFSNRLGCPRAGGLIKLFFKASKAVSS